MARVVCVGRGFPDHYYSQEELVAALTERWSSRHRNVARLAQVHRNVMVGGRHLALPIEGYEALTDFTAANDAFIEVGLNVGERAVRAALAEADLEPSSIDHIFFVSVTGIATPSLDARLINRVGFRRDIKRTPIFGLGCVAGAAGVARVFDYLRAYPNHRALLVSVELCSLTLQREDLSVPNIVASGLFGDGGACVVMEGEAIARASRPRVVATKSNFYPNTEEVMGWRIGSSGFRVVLSADVPKVAQENIGGDVRAFLVEQGLGLADIGTFVCHPGGPKVLEAFETALALNKDELRLTWESLRSVGNLSSASVLMVLADTLEKTTPEPGSYGLMLAMGPGFCSELVLLQW